MNKYLADDSIRYYIVGDNSYGEKTTAEKTSKVFSHFNLEFALSEFEKYIREIRYSHMYLIADFGTNKKLFGSSKLSDDFDPYLPFMVISEWEIGSDAYVRSDLTYIEQSGITRQFNNNLAALKLFTSLLKDNKPATLKISYAKKYILNKGSKAGSHKYVIRYFDRTIADTAELSTLKKIHYCKKVVIDDQNWMFLEKDEPHFYNYQLQDENVDNIPELVVGN